MLISKDIYITLQFVGLIMRSLYIAHLVKVVCICINTSTLLRAFFWLKSAIQKKANFNDSCY